MLKVSRAKLKLFHVLNIPDEQPLREHEKTCLIKKIIQNLKYYLSVLWFPNYHVEN